MSGTARSHARPRRHTAAVWCLSVAAVVVVACAVLIAGNASGRPGLAVGVAAVQAGFLAGWLLWFAATPEAAVIAVVAVAVADFVLLRTRAASGGSIAGVIGLAVIATLFHQLARRDPRGVTTAVAVTVSAVVLGAAPALLIPLRELPAGRSAVFVAVIASGAALVAVRLPSGPDPVRRIGALVVGVITALLCGLGTGGLSTGHAIAMGICCAVTVLLVDRLVTRIAGERKVEPAPVVRLISTLPSAVVTALVPLVLAFPVAYLVGRVIAPAAG